MYKYIYVAIALIVIPMFAGAAYNDVSLTTGATISVDSYSLTVSGSTSVVESIVVNPSDFVVTMPASSVLVVQSAEKNVMTVSGIGGNDYTQVCASDYNTLTVTISSGSTRSVKVTPSATICTVASATTPSGSRSSGGGGSISPVTVVTPPVIPAIILGCPTGFTCTPNIPQVVPSCPPGLVCTPTAITNNGGQSLPVPAVSAFTRRLITGTSGDDVRNLQKILNADVDTKIADSGVGSAGNETNFFGGLTRAAVQKFQVKHGIANPGDEGYGQVGPKTRAKLNQLGGQIDFVAN